MATVTFLWHLHQPGYRTADGISHTPWVSLHAGGSYTTLARAILETGARGHVVNIVPTLLEQMVAYRDGTVVDPVIDTFTSPTSELDADERQILLEWGFTVTPRQMARFPRLRELAVRRSASLKTLRDETHFGPGDLRDLQVLLILSQAGEQAWRDSRLAPLNARGRRFSVEEHAAAADWLRQQPGELLELWHEIAELPGVEIASSPYAHPIMPLLIDSAVVSESWAPNPAPEVPDFQHPGDARWQLEEGLAYMRSQGFEITGCWPPEGSVSEAALHLYSDAGVRWLVADEGILGRSLDMDLRDDGGAREELYRPWRPVSPSPILFFRDRHLSDRIGFTYGNWKDEEEAAEDLVVRLEELAATLPSDGAIVIALDGENPWLHYPKGGGVFLRTLMSRLDKCDATLQPATLSQLAATSLPRLLPRVHPGSWINSVFATWIGHPEKTQAWRVLARVRSLIEATPSQLPPSLMLAEGSDWFWWLGDDNPNPQAPLFDRIFRHHLSDACRQAGVTPPAALDRPIKMTTKALRVPVSERWPKPTINGRADSYFEWSLATSISSDGDGGLRRFSVWSDRSALFILVEGEPAMSELVEQEKLVIHLQPPDGDDEIFSIEGDGDAPEDADIAVGKVVEIALPWTPAPGFRLQVGLGPQQLPGGASVLLEPFEVD